MMTFVIVYLFIGILLIWFADHLAPIQDLWVLLFFIIIWPIIFGVMIYAIIESVHEKMEELKNDIK